MDKEILFKPRLPEEEVELPGVGTVRVRALSRSEAIRVQAVEETGARERCAVALGMVQPRLTEDEVGRWQSVAPAGELSPVAERINVLSGLAEDSAKTAYKSNGGESGAGVRTLPSDEAGDDGGPAARGAE